MDGQTAQRHLMEARVARLATVDATGKPHLVPITYAVEGETIYFAVDAKPKRTTHLQRLRNIAANPSVSVLVDHYEDDWKRLWWVRVDGTAHVLDDAVRANRIIDLLARRYPQYALSRPQGPVVAISVQRITGWAADENPGR